LAERLAADPCALRKHLEPLDSIPGNPGGIEDIMTVAEDRGVDLHEEQTVLIVGHEGRLSNLVMQVTGKRCRPIPHGGAVAVHADSVETMLKAHGVIDFRFPVVDHQEADLRPKIQSKMTVASFLAGFVSAALVSTLFVDDFTTRRQVAAVLLTLALALFVITVYLYDELSMPEGFWLSGRRSAVRRRLERRQERNSDRRWQAVADGLEADAPELDEVRWIEDEAAWRHARADEDAAQVEQDGPLYTWMVGTWRWAFTPALMFALVGFWLITFDAGSAAAAIGSVLAIAIAVFWLTLRRPPLGTD
jgi:hypothetical protein